MKRIEAAAGRLILLPLVIFVALTGCSAQQVSASPDREQLLVLASFSTMADFAQKIGGERVEVRTLVPAGADAHDWEPSAQDMMLLEQADLLVISGAGFEHWVDRVDRALDNAALVLVDASADIDLLDGVDHGDHYHEQDPHVWLDPMNAAGQMKAIAQAFAAADPEGESLYSENYEKYAAACEELDRAYGDALESLPGREIVVAHAAYGYLCQRYGLEQVAVEGLSPEGEPDPAKMAQVIAQAREHGAKVVFFEQSASPKVAQAIAREIGAETAVLSPLEGFTEAEAAAGADYFSVMMKNLEQLKVALA